MKITITLPPAKQRRHFAPATVRFVDKKKEQKRKECRK
jgi:hypothetical protein